MNPIQGGGLSLEPHNFEVRIEGDAATSNALAACFLSALEGAREGGMGVEEELVWQQAEPAGGQAFIDPAAPGTLFVSRRPS